MNALKEIDDKELILNLEMIVRSDRVFEDIYDANSPTVIKETQGFSERAKISTIFSETWRRLSTRSKVNAEVIGTFWHHFSSLAPQVMCIAAAKVSNNLMRHYIVQIIFEELGSRKYKMIHSDIFLDCLQELKVTDSRRGQLVNKYLPLLSFDYLLKIMNEADSDSKLLGILLGLEIDAEENISTVFDALSSDEEAGKITQESLFFRIHKVVEVEHIRLDVANYLRFCPTPKEKEEFQEGFDEAVLFWKMFWDGITRIIDKENIA